jgi:tetratricopeptide (TPR) repeat protein
MKRMHFAAILLMLCAVLPAAEPAQREDVAAVKKTKDQLWKTYTAPPRDDAGAASLQQAIAEVKSIHVSEGSAPGKKSASKSATSQPTSAPATQPVEAAPTESPAEMIATLKNLPLESIPHPLNLGDSLFENGQLEAALVVYEKAFAAEKNPPDRAWLMFQIANCKRQGQPDEAVALYRRLIREYPDSPWAPVSDCRARLVEWYQADNPRAVLGSK